MNNFANERRIWIKPFCNLIQDPKLYDKLLTKHGEQLDEKSLTICSGVDYTNINYQHVVCPDPVTAKVNLLFM